MSRPSSAAVFRHAGFVGLILACLALASGVASPRGALADAPKKTLKAERDAYRAAEEAAVRAKSPAAADALHEALAASDAKDDARALTLLGKASQRLPHEPHLLRRLCLELVLSNRRAEGLPLCREALVLERNADSLGQLAIALTMGGAATAPEGVEALDDARRAADMEPDRLYPLVILAQVALLLADDRALAIATERMRRIGPDEPMTWGFSALGAYAASDLRAGDEYGARARALGLDPAFGAMLDDVRRRATETHRELTPVGRGLFLALELLGGWIGGLVLLCLCGLGLSAATLRATRGDRGRVASGRKQEGQEDQEGHEERGRSSPETRRSEAALRTVYRGVLWLTCVYYWLSLPVVLLLVIGGGAAAILGILSAGFIAPKLFIIIALIVLGTLWAMLKSLFARRREEEPGVKLDLSQMPALEGVLAEVAARIGTRTVDTVYLTPGTDLAVAERGGLLRQLGGRTERMLLLGVGVLDGMKLRELKSILAHEFGHFRNEDTAGGGFALAVRRSLILTTVHLAQSGAASAVNPAWWFVRGFLRVFLRISQGASRLQEILADRWAAHAYGSDTFVSGFRHVVAQGIRFDKKLELSLDEAVKSRTPVLNLYTLEPTEPLPSEKIDEAIEAAMTREPSPYDSHPAPAERIAMVEALAEKGVAESEDDDEDAWTVLEDREAWESTMTEHVRSLLKRQGIALLAKAPAVAGVAGGARAGVGAEDRCAPAPRGRG